MHHPLSPEEASYWEGLGYRVAECLVQYRLDSCEGSDNAMQKLEELIQSITHDDAPKAALHIIYGVIERLASTETTS